MTCTVKEIHRLPGGGNLKGFAVAEVRFSGGETITIRGLRIIQQPSQKAYLALPQERSQDGRYFPILTTQDTRLKETLQAAVLQAWSRDSHEQTGLL
jgi:DNA-binding cell septation regulator SpoVG